MANKIQLRRDTAANWTSVNPTLSQGEQGYETDTGNFKIGDGTTVWSGLTYFQNGALADVETVGDITSSTLDLSTGNVFSDAPATSPTYVFSNPPASGTAYGFTFKVTPSATVTITWPASVDWPSGTAPDAPASGETDVFVFYTQDGGTTYYGFVAGEAMA